MTDPQTSAVDAEREGLSRLWSACISMEAVVLSSAEAGGLAAGITKMIKRSERAEAELARLRAETREVIHNAIALFGTRCNDEAQRVWLKQARAALSSEPQAAAGERGAASSDDAAAKAVYSVIREMKNPFGKSWDEMTEHERDEPRRIALAAIRAIQPQAPGGEGA